MIKLNFDQMKNTCFFICLGIFFSFEIQILKPTDSLSAKMTPLLNIIIQLFFKKNSNLVVESSFLDHTFLYTLYPPPPVK